MEVIVKFFPNETTKEGEAPLISRTLGKVAIVARAYMERARVNPKHHQMPGPQEFWRVLIIKELQKGQRAGCFLVQPMERVDEDSLLHLAPGMYVMEKRGGVLVVTPNPEYQGRNCIMPLEFKHMYAAQSGTYSTLVDVTPPKIAPVFEDRRSRRAENPYRHT